MHNTSDIYLDSTRENPEGINIIDLLNKHGNLLFDSSPSSIQDVELAALFLEGCANSGPICDIGAGEGAAALALACLLDRDVVAIEVVAERVERIAQRAERHGVANLTAIAADARSLPLGEFSGFYLFSPFFDDEADRFLARLAEECRPRTRVVGKGMIAKRMCAQPALHVVGEDGGWGWCTAELA